MEPPEVEKHTWIKFGSGSFGTGQDGYVLRKFCDSKLEVGYYQNSLKAIAENVIWTGERWEFEIEGPCGRYLSGPEEAIVKKGPHLT